jgi:chromate transporter
MQLTLYSDCTQEDIGLNCYLDLFLTFARIGVCTFGGGYAMLPILQREVGEKKGWATDEELSDYFAIGQCTPGIIAVNTATFVGAKQKGTLGGICATLGLVFPCLVIISLIAAFLQNFAELAVVQHAFNGVRACVCVLIFNAVMKLRKSTVIDLPTLVLFVVVLILALVASFGNPTGVLNWLLSPAVLVVMAGICGLGIKEVGKK